MNTGNQNIAGYNIIHNGKSNIISKKDTDENLDNFKIKLIEATKNYKQYDVLSHMEDIMYLVNVVNMNVDKKLTTGNIIEINTDIKKDENFIEEIKKLTNHIIKWAYVKELRDLIDDIFESDITKNLYKNTFNISIKKLFFKKLHKSIKKSKNDYDLEESINPEDQLKQNIFQYYKKFVLFLYEDPETPNFYDIFKLVKNEYLPNKDNEIMIEILTNFKNGKKIIEISNRIYKNDFFDNFEEIDLSKHSIL